MIDDASATAPTPARPSLISLTSVADCAITTPARPATINGHEKLAYDRSAPRSQRSRSGNGDASTAASAPASEPATMPTTSAQYPAPAAASTTVATNDT